MNWPMAAPETQPQKPENDEHDGDGVKQIMSFQ